MADLRSTDPKNNAVPVQTLQPLAAAEKLVLTPLAKEFLSALHRRFNPIREDLLSKRTVLQLAFDQGKKPGFLSTTEQIRKSDWKVAPTPAGLMDRRVEITGPVERKMMINGLNSAAKVFMADFEDATSPTWSNIILGQLNCYDAVRKQISLSTPEGKTYALAKKTATLFIRPRGWHLSEKNFSVDGTPISASLFDFGLYFFHNAKALIDQGAGPYFYLPKLENHHEARLWAEIFEFAERALEIPAGTIRATVLIETITAAFEMDEILYELRNYSAGLNAGRWDYIFSYIKKFREDPTSLLPDRAQVTMAVPQLRAYTNLLVKTCHRRGAHAIGGMSAFIPNRKDQAVTSTALARVREDKTRETNDGFDGTWVAHPDLVPVALECFDEVLKDKPHQREKLRNEVAVSEEQLLTVCAGNITEGGIRTNITIALLYLESWLSGVGAVAIHNLMEDAATAEISRAQLWQWRKHAAKFTDATGLDRYFDENAYRDFRDDELRKLNKATLPKLGSAAEILDHLVLEDEFEEFLTLPAYKRI